MSNFLYNLPYTKEAFEKASEIGRKQGYLKQNQRYALRGRWRDSDEYYSENSELCIIEDERLIGFNIRGTNVDALKHHLLGKEYPYADCLNELSSEVSPTKLIEKLYPQDASVLIENMRVLDVYIKNPVNNGFACYLTNGTDNLGWLPNVDEELFINELMKVLTKINFKNA